MPTYEFSCPSCEHDFERILKLSEYETPQLCPQCGAVSRRWVSKTSFVLAGDDWPSKALRVKGQMSRKNRRLDRKMKDHREPLSQRLSPNVGGERVDSWAEAQKLAASKGKDASSYEPFVRQEKRDVP
jgi:putative FmdB family regulatory protein